jgi:hypothetical protein
MIFVSRERYGRASGRFGGTIGNIGELGGNLERLGGTMHLPWVMSDLALDLLPNYYQIAF